MADAEREHAARRHRGRIVDLPRPRRHDADAAFGKGAHDSGGGSAVAALRLAHDPEKCLALFRRRSPPLVIPGSPQGLSPESMTIEGRDTERSSLGVPRTEVYGYGFSDVQCTSQLEASPRPGMTIGSGNAPPKRLWRLESVAPKN